MDDRHASRRPPSTNQALTLTWYVTTRTTLAIPARSDRGARAQAPRCDTHRLARQTRPASAKKSPVGDQGLLMRARADTDLEKGDAHVQRYACCMSRGSRPHVGAITVADPRAQRTTGDCPLDTAANTVGCATAPLTAASTATRPRL